MGVVASWGARVLSVDAEQIKTFSDLTRRSGYKTEEQEDGKNKPGTTRVAPELETVSMTVLLSRALGVDAAAEADAWRAACDKGIPNKLFLGGAPIGKNMYLLQSLQQTGCLFDGAGKLVACKLDITFQEYRKEMERPVAEAASASGAATGSSSKRKAVSTTVTVAVQGAAAGGGGGGLPTALIY